MSLGLQVLCKVTNSIKSKSRIPHRRKSTFLPTGKTFLSSTGINPVRTRAPSHQFFYKPKHVIYPEKKNNQPLILRDLNQGIFLLL